MAPARRGRWTPALPLPRGGPPLPGPGDHPAALITPEIRDKGIPAGAAGQRDTVPVPTPSPEAARWQPAAHIEEKGPPRKTAFTMLWCFLLAGSAVVGQLLLRDRSPASLGAEVAEEAYVAPLGGMPTTTIPEEPLFEVPDKPESPTATIPRTPHQAIEDTGHSMCGFYKALAALDRGTRGDSVRVLHYGDSIITTDQVTGRVRRQLQKRFGDGGHGFVLLGKPWRWYRHQDVSHGAFGEWQVKALTFAPLRRGIFGLGGVAFDTSHPRARAWVGTSDEGEQGRRVASFDISYFLQPRGGSMDVILNDAVLETISTRGETRMAAHKVIPVPPGAHSLAIKTRGDGPVRVFGAVLESDTHGVVYDTLAINGVRAPNFLRFDETHFASELQRRRANLVIMMCGANEGSSDNLVLHAYKETLGAVLGRIRKAVPEAACLVVGPLDQAERSESGKLVSKAMPRKLNQVQREVALESGCAFFDAYNAMGGKESMPKWWRRGLVGGDFIHPTEKGALLLGSWLTEALLAGYEHFIFNGEKCGSNATI